MRTAYIIVLCLAVLLPSIAAQDGSIGTCSAETVNSFVGSLPNGEACGQALVNVLYANQSTASTQEYTTDALTTFCQVDCGGKIAGWSFLTCGEEDLATALFIYCLPRDNGGNDRCRSTAPDLVDEQLVTNLGTCMSTDTGCPAGCAAALQAARNDFGCCYQTIYNNTDIVNYLVSVGAVTADDRAVIDTVSNSALWDDCNVTLTSVCTGDPFPGESELLVGNCSSADFTVLGSMVTPECGAVLTTVFETHNTALLDTYCDASCANPHIQFVRENCQDPVSANLSSAYCFDTMGNLGERCGLVINNVTQIVQVFENAGSACFSTDGEVCPDGCGDALQMLRNRLGCCYQSIYNDTLILDGFLLSEVINFEERIFFGALGDNDLWDTCDVPRIPKCSSGIDGAVRLVASTIMMVSMAAFAFLL